MSFQTMFICPNTDTSGYNTANNVFKDVACQIPRPLAIKLALDILGKQIQPSRNTDEVTTQLLRL